MSVDKANELGYVPWAYLRDWSFRSCDPWEELLLGPTYCSHEIFQRNQLTMQDIGVFEIHEGTSYVESSYYESNEYVVEPNVLFLFFPEIFFQQYIFYYLLSTTYYTAIENK